MFYCPRGHIGVRIYNISIFYIRTRVKNVGNIVKILEFGVNNMRGIFQFLKQYKNCLIIVLTPIVLLPMVLVNQSQVSSSIINNPSNEAMCVVQIYIYIEDAL